MGRKNLLKTRVGKLHLVKRISPVGEKRIIWGCKCDCGNYLEVLNINLMKGQRDCGCVHLNYHFTGSLIVDKLYKGEKFIEAELYQSVWVTVDRYDEKPLRIHPIHGFFTINLSGNKFSIIADEPVQGIIRVREFREYESPKGLSALF